MVCFGFLYNCVPEKKLSYRKEGRKEGREEGREGGREERKEGWKEDSMNFKTCANTFCYLFMSPTCPETTAAVGKSFFRLTEPNQLV